MTPKILVDRVKGGGRVLHPPTAPGWADITIMMECTTGSRKCHSLYSADWTTRHIYWVCSFNEFLLGLLIEYEGFYNLTFQFLNIRIRLRVRGRVEPIRTTGEKACFCLLCGFTETLWTKSNCFLRHVQNHIPTIFRCCFSCGQNTYISVD
jgi:hypothetical protein